MRMCTLSVQLIQGSSAITDIYRVPFSLLGMSGAKTAMTQNQKPKKTRQRPQCHLEKEFRTQDDVDVRDDKRVSVLRTTYTILICDYMYCTVCV